MAYIGGVPVNSGFYPRNNQDFPIADAKDIYVSDDQRLDAALEELKRIIDEKCSDISTETILHGESLLSNIIETYILDIDYEKLLKFETDEIVVDFSNTSAIIGKAIIGQMILGNS